MFQHLTRYLRTHRTDVILFLVSFVVHLAASIFLFSKYNDQVLFFENEDAHDYVNLAQSVVAGHGFARGDAPNAVRTPAYPLLLALLLLCHLPFTWGVLLLHNMLASFAGVMLYRVGKNLFSERTGKIAGYLYVLEPYMLMTANLATTETFFNVLLISFLYVFSRYMFANEKKIQWRMLIISSILLGLATLTRPVALYVPTVVVFLMIVLYVRKMRSLKQVLSHVAVWLAVFLAVLAPWSIRQYREYRTLRITNIDANMMYFRIAPIVVSDDLQVSYVEAIQKLKERIEKQFPHFDGERVYTSFEYYAFMTGETTRLVAEKPFLVMKYYALSLIPGLTGTGYEYMLENVVGLRRTVPRANFTELLLHNDLRGYLSALAQVDIFAIARIGGALVWVAVYLLIFYAFWRKVSWQKDGVALVVLLLFAAYFIFFSLGPQIHARYRMPTLPFLYLLFAYAYDRCFRHHPRIQ